MSKNEHNISSVHTNPFNDFTIFLVFIYLIYCRIVGGNIKFEWLRILYIFAKFLNICEYIFSFVNTGQHWAQQGTKSFSNFSQLFHHNVRLKLVNEVNLSRKYKNFILYKWKGMIPKNIRYINCHKISYWIFCTIYSNSKSIAELSCV